MQGMSNSGLALTLDIELSGTGEAGDNTVPTRHTRPTRLGRRERAAENEVAQTQSVSRAAVDQTWTSLDYKAQPVTTMQARRSSWTSFVPAAILLLGMAQKNVVQMSSEAKALYLTRSKDLSLVLQKHNLFPLPPDAHGASHAASTGELTIMEMLMGESLTQNTHSYTAHSDTYLKLGTGALLLSFTQDCPVFSTKTAQRTLQVQLR